MEGNESTPRDSTDSESTKFSSIKFQNFNEMLKTARKTLKPSARDKKHKTIGI